MTKTNEEMKEWINETVDISDKITGLSDKAKRLFDKENQQTGTKTTIIEGENVIELEARMLAVTVEGEIKKEHIEKFVYALNIAVEEGWLEKGAFCPISHWIFGPTHQRGMILCCALTRYSKEELNTPEKTLLMFPPRSMEEELHDNPPIRIPQNFNESENDFRSEGEL